MTLNNKSKLDEWVEGGGIKLFAVVTAITMPLVFLVFGLMLYVEVDLP